MDANPVVLITGGGRGLGQSFALALAQTGAQVAVTARSESELAQTVVLIEQAGGRALALGRADALGGCFLSVDDNLEDLLAQAEAVRREQRLMLRLRTV